MSKRFTETAKWHDPWYRRLSSPAKQLWEYMRDNCDPIGLVEIDFGLVSSDCGQKINESNLTELGDRVQLVNDRKFFLPKFIHFQYGELTPTCPPHRSVIKLVSAHSLIRVGLHYSYPNAKVALPLRQDKTRQDKNGSTEGVQGEGNPPVAVAAPPTPPKEPIKPQQPPHKIQPNKLQQSHSEFDEVVIAKVKERVGVLFRRPPGDAWSYAEDCQALEISRRPRYLSEIQELCDYHRRKPKYFAQSVEALLRDWTKYLDRSRVPEVEDTGISRVKLINGSDSHTLIPGNTGCPGV